MGLTHPVNISLVGRNTTTAVSRDEQVVKDAERVEIQRLPAPWVVLPLGRDEVVHKQEPLQKAKVELGRVHGLAAVARGFQGLTPTSPGGGGTRRKHPAWRGAFGGLRSAILFRRRGVPASEGMGRKGRTVENTLPGPVQVRPSFRSAGLSGMPGMAAARLPPRRPAAGLEPITGAICWGPAYGSASLRK